MSFKERGYVGAQWDTSSALIAELFWPSRYERRANERQKPKSRGWERMSDELENRKFTDIRVRTANPSALDATVQQLPMCAAVVIDGSWDGDVCTVRVLAGDPGFLRFAIENQGYGEVLS